jgi:hypothetical protein
MLISRILTSFALKWPNRFVLNNSRYFLSNLSSEKKVDPQNESDSVSTKKSTDDNNEWLWGYLRGRRSFSELTVEQRRRVIEIGKLVIFFGILYAEYYFIELQTLRESGERVPDIIPDERWTELISLPLLETRKTLYG